MELIEYSADTDTAKISVSIADFAAISSLLLGVWGSYNLQDPTILGVTKERVEKLHDATTSVMSDIADQRGRGTIKGI